MPATDRRYVTEAEFYELPESMERVELFDGEVVVSPAVTPRHQKVLRRLVLAIDAWARSRSPRWEAFFSPIDVRFAVDRILQPDLLLFDRVLPEDHPRTVDLVPVLVAEVLSPSTEAYDRFGKRLAYAEAGVRACLLVDTDRELVEVFTGGGLRERAVCRERLTVPGLDGLDVDLDAVFAREPG